MGSYSWPNVFCVVCAAYQPPRSQYSPIISSVDFIHYFEVSEVQPLPTFHPFVSTHDTTSICATAQIFYLIWWKILKATTSSKVGLKMTN